MPIKNIKTKQNHQGNYFVKGLIQAPSWAIFPGQNEMNEEKKWDPSQGWMHASLLISRACCSCFHLHHWEDTNQYCIYSQLSVCQIQVMKALEEVRMRLVHMTTVVEWLQYLLCLWIRLGWLTDTAWTSRSRMRHNDLADFTTWTDMLNDYCGQVSGCWFCQGNI